MYHDYSSTNWPLIILIISWIILTIMNAFIGSNRKIGGAEAFMYSLIFSPVVGLIVVAFSKDLDDEIYKEEIKLSINKQTEILIALKNKFAPDPELEKMPGVELTETEKKQQEHLNRLKEERAMGN